MRRVPRRTVLAIASAVVFIAGSDSAFAGPSYDLDTKVLRAQAIVEVEITLLPKSLGWKAANTRAQDRKVLRTIFRAPDFNSADKTPPYFPFSLASRCWSRVGAERKIRVLAFYPQDIVAGLEEDAGAYTSLNGDYDRVVEAIATVSEWRRAPKSSVRQHLSIIAKTSNPYLRFLGAQFAKQYDESSDPSIEAIIKDAPDALTFPVAECDRPASTRRLTGR